jgi:hypothetical protein
MPKRAGDIDAGAWQLRAERDAELVTRPVLAEQGQRGQCLEHQCEMGF